MRLILILIIAYLLHATALQAQSIKVQQGVVFKKGTNIRIGNAEVSNKRSKFKVVTDHFGIFRILTSTGDTLEISGAGYLPQKFIVSDFKDAILYLSPTNELQEIYVKEKTIQKELKEIQESYRGKGVYYKGKPPIYLLIFKPLTFINELVGKNAKRARRFNIYAERELDYYAVSNRFNDYSIKNVVPTIKDDEIEGFKSAYWPTAEQIKRWNDYDLISYIKRSYLSFKEKHQKGMPEKEY